MRAGACRRELRLDLDRAALAVNDADRRDDLEHVERLAVFGEQQRGEARHALLPRALGEQV
jgi:hypothetical protein